MIEFKKVEITASRQDQDLLCEEIYEAVDQLERQTRMLLRLYSRQHEDFYLYSRQTKASVREVISRVKDIEDREERNNLSFKARRVKSVVSFLEEHGPYIGGSGVLSSARPGRKIESVVSGGLPGLGKKS